MSLKGIFFLFLFCFCFFQYYFSGLLFSFSLSLSLFSLCLIMTACSACGVWISAVRGQRILLSAVIPFVENGPAHGNPRREKPYHEVVLISLGT
ncbi:uncharacterized protein F4807DRAFT_171110 [Annulohypoxylon truncatum]|uniref:uncharacterized protein n=1 Tax=Annulohypoxylon truncatum TaxID=327061 RepID=UPI0020073CED|nr:uncharacterized protein F4807DRAFT_171110 [Annulohypoxylon truncatum]KAI1207568.1 hypothetical protein F4807DRAFT_171110 [Annulohypoxylon truncatum]